METAEPVKSKPRTGSETRRKQRRATVRLNAEEYAELTAAAERAGQTVGTYIRARTLAAPTTRARHRPTVETELLAKAVAQLGRIGGNLHQIARRLNFGEIEHAAELPVAIAEFRKVVSALMAAAGRTPP